MPVIDSVHRSQLSIFICLEMSGMITLRGRDRSTTSEWRPWCLRTTTINDQNVGGPWNLMPWCNEIYDTGWRALPQNGTATSIHVDSRVSLTDNEIGGLLGIPGTPLAGYYIVSVE